MGGIFLVIGGFYLCRHGNFFVVEEIFFVNRKHLEVLYFGAEIFFFVVRVIYRCRQGHLSLSSEAFKKQVAAMRCQALVRGNAKYIVGIMLC